MDEPDVQRQIEETFGKTVFTDSGKVDRGRLASQAFENTENIKKLNKISHPRIGERIAEVIKDHQEAVEKGESRGAAAILILDVSLLASSPLRKQCDEIVFVDADRATRLARCQERGWSPDEMDKRDNYQASLEDKRALASRVITNSGPLDETRRQVVELLGQLV